MNDRPPNIFECQLRLWTQWFESWSEGERNTFVTSLEEKDPAFVAHFYSRVAGTAGRDWTCNVFNLYVLFTLQNVTEIKSPMDYYTGVWTAELDMHVTIVQALCWLSKSSCLEAKTCCFFCFVVFSKIKKWCFSLFVSSVLICCFKTFTLLILKWSLAWKLTFCHGLLTVMSFQSCMHLFLLWYT